VNKSYHTRTWIAKVLGVTNEKYCKIDLETPGSQCLLSKWLILCVNCAVERVVGIGGAAIGGPGGE
jgi:hypothetical protein